MVCAYFGGGVTREEVETVEEDDYVFWAKIPEEARVIGEAEKMKKRDQYHLAEIDITA